MTLAKPLRMTADEFLEWAMDQPEGQRYELAGGEVVAMAPERAAPALVKLAATRALQDGVTAAGLSYEVYPDGMAVRIDDATVYEPDALVRCGDPIDRNAIEVTDPVVVVEVLSPSTRARDSGAKLDDYFRLPSVRHYLIVKTETRNVIHHERRPDGSIATVIVASGAIDLAPPGIGIGVEDLFATL